MSEGVGDVLSADGVVASDEGDSDGQAGGRAVRRQIGVASVDRAVGCAVRPDISEWEQLGRELCVEMVDSADLGQP
jgi:hypothetical protein